MRVAGLFRVLVPAELDGPASDLRTYVEVLERTAYGLGAAGWNLATSTVEALYATGLRRPAVDAIYGAEIDDEGKKVKKVGEQKVQVAENLSLELMETGKKDPTLWDAFNAVTYQTSHQIDGRRTQRLLDRGDRRFETVLFGQGHKIRQKAFNAALAALTN